MATAENGPSLSNENSPLLIRDRERDAETTPTPTPPLQDPFYKHPVVLICLLLILLIEIGEYLQAAPVSEILESILCRKYYPDAARNALESGEESPCQDKAIQGELAMLRGWQRTLDFLPGILTAIPYGFAADKYGRKAVLCLSILGVTLQLAAYEAVCWWPNVFPVRLTLLTSAFQFIGGGGTVVAALIFTTIADVVSDQQRSTTFFFMGAMILSGELIGSPLASITMTKSPWLPMFLANGLYALSIFIALAIPETRGLHVPGKTPPDLAIDRTEWRPETHRLKQWMSQARARFSKLGTAVLVLIWGNWNVVLLLLTFPVGTLGRNAQEILLQYVTNRYSWKWAEAGFLLSLRAFSSLILLVVLLPALSHLLTTKLSFSSQEKDLWLARASGIFLAVGTFSIGIAGTPVIMTIALALYSLGTGFKLLARSLITSITEPHHLGTLYNTVAMLETIGQIVAGPLLSTSFRVGLEWGGVWMGLPFILAGVLFALATVTVWVVRIPSTNSENSED